MKQVIRGKLYDTDRAQAVAVIVGVDLEREVLYRTCKGAWFIHHVEISGIVAEDHSYLKALEEEQVKAWIEQPRVESICLEEYFTFEDA